MTNNTRGEIEVTLGGERHTMRPTFQAMCEIENTTEMGLVELAQRFSEGRFGGQHVTAIILAGLRGAYNDPPSYEEIGEQVVKQGFQDLAGPVSAFLAVLLTGEEQAAPGGPRKTVGVVKKKARRTATAK